MAFVFLFLCFFQGVGEGGMVEVAPVGLPPSEQGNLFWNFFIFSFVCLFLILWRITFYKYFEIHCQ